MTAPRELAADLTENARGLLGGNGRLPGKPFSPAPGAVGALPEKSKTLKRALLFRRLIYGNTPANLNAAFFLTHDEGRVPAYRFPWGDAARLP